MSPPDIRLAHAATNHLIWCAVYPSFRDPWPV